MTSELIVYRQGQVQDLSEAEPSISRAIRWGAMVILIAFGGAFSWGFLVTLDSAAHATGVIVVEGNRKTIQHLEGGIRRPNRRSMTATWSSRVRCCSVWTRQKPRRPWRN